jgi:phosphoribosylformylglycinamidine synthase subunit PurL
VILLGDARDELGGSEYLKVTHGLVRGVPPALDLERERNLQQLLVGLAADGLMASAHDCAEGGLAITIAECSFDTGLGVEVNVAAVQASDAAFTDIATLYGESASRVLVSVTPSRAHEVLARAAERKVPAAVIGRVGGNQVRLAIDGRVVIDESLAAAEGIYSTAIERYFTARAGKPSRAGSHPDH